MLITYKVSERNRRDALLSGISMPILLLLLLLLLSDYIFVSNEKFPFLKRRFCISALVFCDLLQKTRYNNKMIALYCRYTYFYFFFAFNACIRKIEMK